MFREIILPIFRSTRLCVTACGVMHPPRCCRPSAVYLLICSFLPCLSWLLRSRVRKSRRDLGITLYVYITYFTRPENTLYVDRFSLLGISSSTHHSNCNTLVVETNNPLTSTKNTEHARIINRNSINVNVCYVVIGHCTAYW